MESLQKSPIPDLKKDIERMIIRSFIKGALSNYDKNKTYIIYDGDKIEIYDPSVLALKKATKSVKSYLISKPVRMT